MVSKRLVYAMGIDPGGTSGWGVIGVPRSSMFFDGPRKIEYFDCGQVTGGYTDQAYHLAEIADYYNAHRSLAIAMETFIPKKTVIDEYYLSPLQIIYRIDMLRETGTITARLFYQTPEQAMSTATDKRLKAWGIYQPGPDHIKDGTRHAITFIRRAIQSKSLREAAWAGRVSTRQNASDRPALTAASKRTASRA